MKQRLGSLIIILTTSTIFFIGLYSLFILSDKPRPLGAANNYPNCKSSEILLPVIFRNHINYYLNTWEVENNNYYTRANGPLLSNKDYKGYPDEKDYFSVFLNTDGIITVSVREYTGLNPQVQLYYQNPYHPLNVTIPYCTSIPCTLVYTLSPNEIGWYYIYLSSDGPYSIEATPYQLKVQYPMLPTSTPKPQQTLSPIPNCTQTPTPTSTSVSFAQLLCPLVSSRYGSYIIVFDGEKIFSNKTISDAQTNEVTISIPGGEYNINLASYDAHSAHPAQRQTDERWYLILYDETGMIIATSEPSDDLPETVDCATMFVGQLYFSENVYSVAGFHAAYPVATTESPNSVAPVYAILEPVLASTPQSRYSTPLPPYYTSTPTPTPYN